MTEHPGRARRRAIAGVVAVVVAASAGAGWYLTHRSDDQAQTAAQTTTTLQAATVGTVSQTLTISGTFAPAQEADLDFASSGTITAVDVAVGDKVTKGQVLATIDDTDLAAALADAKNTLSTAQENLESVQSSGTSTQIAAAKATVASDASKVSQARKALAAASLTAPFSGTVATVNIAAGDTSGSSSGGGATAGASGSGVQSAGGSSSSGSTSAIVLVDTTSWTVNASVSSADLAQLAKGQNAQVSISTATSSTNSRSGAFAGGFGGGNFGGAAGGNGGSGAGSSLASSGSSGSTTTTTGTALPGTVKSVGIVGTTSTGSTATFPVVITVSGTESGIYVGTSASVVVTTKAVNNVLSVPTQAISTADGKSVVTVSQEGHTKQVAVTTGSVYGTRTQVLSGISAGQMVQVTSRGPGGFGGGSFGGTGTSARPAGQPQ
ncbi:efflux RND transporter periplasmic adaptor subunit [Branchiibius cervicis]|uniref:Efflux RND transporter periplasmic adaptor subunit n=1 Tax=Branchiibius cervicis TaxID=908252 RepID=A0ABW2ATG2_9MICO